MYVRELSSLRILAASRFCGGFTALLGGPNSGFACGAE